MALENWIISKIPHRISKLEKAYAFRFQSCEIPVTEDQKGYEIVDFDEDAVRVFTAKEPWAAGMFCRSIWQEDGLEYAGLVKSIGIDQDDHHYAVVQFIGYGNEDAVWLQDLMDSNGK